MKVIGFKAKKANLSVDYSRSVTKVDDGFLFETFKTVNEREYKVDEITITNTEVVALVSDQSETAYTLWACWRKQYEENSWINIYQRTFATKISRSEFVKENLAQPFAFVIVPPKGGEPVLVLELFEYGAFPEGCVETEFAQSDFSNIINSFMPAITLSQSEQADGYVKITATSSYAIDGAELRWETTAGSLDAERTKFVGNTTFTLVKLPISNVPFKVKCGFKYYSGVAEIAL